jgi:hypothetical protein
MQGVFATEGFATEANMVTIVAVLVFTGALALSLGVIAAMVLPQWRRIARLASGRIEEPYLPLAELAGAERRIALRRWAAEPVPGPIHRLRAAA